MTAVGTEYRIPIPKPITTRTRHGGSLWVRLFGFRVPLRLCRGAQTGPDQGLRMFEPAGRVCADPGPVEHRRLPRHSRGHRHQGRLFFGDFLLAKQKKVTALPGAHPGKAAITSQAAKKEKPAKSRPQRQEPPRRFRTRPPTPSAPPHQTNHAAPGPDGCRPCCARSSARSRWPVRCAPGRCWASRRPARG